MDVGGMKELHIDPPFGKTLSDGFRDFPFRSGRGCLILESFLPAVQTTLPVDSSNSVHGVTVLPDRAIVQNEIKDPGVPDGHDQAFFLFFREVYCVIRKTGCRDWQACQPEDDGVN
jgi:hypothetical protein